MPISTDLRDAGLTVVEHPGWETRGVAWPVGSPVGIMVHHTAAPVPYPVPNLAGDTDGRVKCNLNVKQDGTVVVIAGRACNYSSGMGSNVVLAETKKATAPPANARERGLVDNTNGNPFYYNIEVDHLGDGSPLPDAAYDALLTACRVVLDTYNRVPDQIVSHAEWTARKIDPYWDGSTRTAAAIRSELETEMPLTPEDVEKVADATVRKLMGWGIWQTSEGGKPIPFEKIVSRNYRNVTELITAWRAGDLCDTSTTLTDEDFARIGQVFVDTMNRTTFEVGPD